MIEQSRTATKENCITIFLKLNGNNCNMKCSYCYSHVDKNKIVIDKSKIVSDTISYLSKFKDYEHVLIVFHGGEPLLSDVIEIREILTFIISNFHNTLNIQLQTNGTLIDENWIQLFKDFKEYLSLSISLDPIGEKNLRVYPPSSSYNDVFQNIILCNNELRNVGVISVIHKYNKNYILDFIDNLVNNNIKSLTINKLQFNNFPYNFDYGISEMEYVDVLIDILKYYIKKNIYKKIYIQPINALLSQKTNKICRFLADQNKCKYFNTFFNLNDYSEFCDHITNNTLPLIEEKCLHCDIYSKCGSGCLIEYKDDTFCEARRKLFRFIGGIRNDN